MVLNHELTNTCLAAAMGACKKASGFSGLFASMPTGTAFMKHFILPADLDVSTSSTTEKCAHFVFASGNKGYQFVRKEIDVA